MNTRPPYVTHDENSGGLAPGAALSVEVFLVVAVPVCAWATPNRPAAAAPTDAKNVLMTDRREALALTFIGDASKKWIVACLPREDITAGWRVAGGDGRLAICRWRLAT